LDKGDKELKKIVREGIEEHGQVKDLLAELAELSATPRSSRRNLRCLMENVEHHVEEEEDEMFKMAEDQIPDETLQRLGSLMQGEKNESKEDGRTTRSETQSFCRKSEIIWEMKEAPASFFLIVFFARPLINTGAFGEQQKSARRSRSFFHTRIVPEHLHRCVKDFPSFSDR
jgi:hypothetical protein